MTAHPDFPEIPQMNALARAASELGYEIVDIAGFLDMVEERARDQRAALTTLEHGAGEIKTANGAVQAVAQDLTQTVTKTSQDVSQSAALVRDLGENSRTVATWVQDLSDRSADVSDTLKAVKNNNTQIASITMQVNTLAINAKIEAARAGESGRGFAVVAEAINELSQATRQAADQISTNIETLTQWISALGSEANSVAQSAAAVLDQSKDTDLALGRMEQSVADTDTQVTRINTQTETVRAAIDAFAPGMNGICNGITATSTGITQAHGRVQRLIDTSEEIVQASAALGGMTDDGPFIDYVKNRAHLVSAAIEQALDTGQLQTSTLFDRTYVPIPNTDPQQVRTSYVDVFDAILPDILEPALEFDPKVVFCAAVDVNGYLPTHNRKFSQTPRSDVVWNTANCRNRRIFDDRVGLKAGRNTAPFLLQVYRRDMGGGAFKMMKDLSAPIMVGGQHWGGLRLAYTF